MLFASHRGHGDTEFFMFTEGRLAATERAQRLGEELAMRNEELSEVAERAGARSFCLTQRSRRHRVFLNAYPQLNSNYCIYR